MVNESVLPDGEKGFIICEDQAVLAANDKFSDKDDGLSDKVEYLYLLDLLSYLIY